MSVDFNGVTPITLTPSPGSATGTDEHRIETAQWALRTFDPSTALYKQASKVIAAYLAGKPLPKV